MKYSVLVFSVLVVLVLIGGVFDGVFAQQQITPTYMPWPIEIEPGEYTYEYDTRRWMEPGESIRGTYLVSTFREAGVTVTDTTEFAMHSKVFADTYHSGVYEDGKKLITMRIVRLTRRATTNEILVAMEEFGVGPGLVLDLAMIAKMDKKRNLDYVVALGNSIRHYEDPLVAKAPFVIYIDGREEREARGYFPDRDLWERAARFIAIVH